MTVPSLLVLTDHNKTTMLTITFVLLIIIFTVVSGASLSDQVHQSPKEIVVAIKSGQVATPTCSHTIQGYDRILWYKQQRGDEKLELLGYMLGEDPYPEKGMGVEMSGSAEQDQTATLTIKNISVESSAVYFCAAPRTDTGNEAYFGKGTKLTVLDPNLRVTPPTVEVLPPSEKECQDPNRKKKKTLVCVASKFYPDHVTVSWFVDDTVITSGVTTDHNAQRKKDHYQITSRLRVTAKEWHAQKEFKCTVSFFNGTETTNHSSSVEGDPKGRKNTEGMTREKFMKVTQTAKLSYCVFIVKNMVYGLFVTVVAWKLGLGRSHATAKK